MPLPLPKIARHLPTRSNGDIDLSARARLHLDHYGNRDLRATVADVARKLTAATEQAAALDACPPSQRGDSGLVSAMRRVEATAATLDTLVPLIKQKETQEEAWREQHAVFAPTEGQKKRLLVLGGIAVGAGVAGGVLAALSVLPWVAAVLLFTALLAAFKAGPTVLASYRVQEPVPPTIDASETRQALKKARADHRAAWEAFALQRVPALERVCRALKR